MVHIFTQIHNQATSDRQEPGHTNDGRPRTRAHRASNEKGTGSHTPLTTQTTNPHSNSDSTGRRQAAHPRRGSLEGKEILSRKGTLMPKHRPATNPPCLRAPPPHVRRASNASSLPWTRELGRPLPEWSRPLSKLSRGRRQMARHQASQVVLLLASRHRVGRSGFIG